MDQVHKMLMTPTLMGKKLMLKKVFQNTANFSSFKKLSLTTVMITLDTRHTKM